MWTDSRQLLRSAPYFPVPDVEQSALYYERVLGFTREYAAGSFRKSLNQPHSTKQSRHGNSEFLVAESTTWLIKHWHFSR